MSEEKRVVVLTGELKPSEAYSRLKSDANLTLEDRALCLSTLIFKSKEFEGYVDDFLGDGSFQEELEKSDIIFQHLRHDVNGKPFLVKLVVEEVLNTTLSKAEKDIIYNDPALKAEYTEPIIVSKYTSQAILDGKLVLGGKTITPKRTSKFVQKVDSGAKASKALAPKK